MEERLLKVVAVVTSLTASRLVYRYTLALCARKEARVQVGGLCVCVGSWA